MFGFGNKGPKVTAVLDSAREIVREIETLVDTCHRKFETVDEYYVTRVHAPSRWLSEAYARELAAWHYIAAIDRDDRSEANQHRAVRAVWVSKALGAAVRALLARAYVELAQKQPAYRKYKALGEQALALSQVTLGGNWEYFIPALLIWEDRELPEAQQRNVSMLLHYGEAALSYALALNAQLKVFDYSSNHALRSVVPEAVKIERLWGGGYYYGDRVPPAAYVLPRVDPCMEDRTRYATRDEVESVWGCSVYDEAREASHYGFRGKWSHDHDYGEPKDRIAGFKLRRGGGGARKRRAVRRLTSGN